MQAVDRVSAVLLSFTEASRDLGVTEIAETVNLPKSAVHRILEALVRTGLLAKDADRGRYRLGPRMLELSIASLGTVDLRSLAQPIMEELRDRTGETVTLSIAIGRQRMYVGQVESKQDVRMTIEVGRRYPLYAGASGRSILMTFPDADLEAYLAGIELNPLTDRTVRDPGRLREMLEIDRRRGYSVSQGERDPYAAAIAAPIIARGTRAVGCFSVCGPHDRLKDSAPERLGPLVVDAAATMSALLTGTNGG
ncbi:transcriptional regulator, IclR family [Pseudonocardia thermophila]|jgi:Transcriptional regulator|uniref:Glycerol operon regulatory protein n=1 Tax=Pseudonocardia thermophila TaxID=1848 RepID=A0A1M6ZXJ0_PSETH|nr:IclR family transcriptional regulator [Pseudonocardia thermophila]SHL35202.1 transcriptional regulator, IclR family [Pseudonocardia thermophila]